MWHSAHKSADFAKKLISGDRRILSRAITLAESSRSEDRRFIASVLESCRLEAPREAIRIGLSGTPGAGKSSFIDVFGVKLLEEGNRVAVLAVDPSSRIAGGSILGDKTRMAELSRREEAFIRPSPSGSHLGGVARYSRTAIALCEAAGFDFILVESVGVGQSEGELSGMVDLFCLLLSPAGGDELQGVKKGVLELADLVLITKADGALADNAARSAADYSGALRLIRKRHDLPPEWERVHKISSLEGKGMAELQGRIGHLSEWRRSEGFWKERRAKQAVQAYREGLSLALIERFEESDSIQNYLTKASNIIRLGEISSEAAIEAALQHIIGPQLAAEPVEIES